MKTIAPSALPPRQAMQVGHAFKKLPLAQPAAVGLCPQRSADLLARLQAEVDSQRLPGAVVVVSRRGKVALFDSLGELDPQTGVKMGKDAIFRIYSMTKPLVSVAIMMLMEQGRVLLADPVAKHLPEFADTQVGHMPTGHGKAKKKLKLHSPQRHATVHDLLRHTAGLTYEFMGNHPVQQHYIDARIGSRQRSNADFSETLAGLPLLLEPGSAWEYSRATDVLGRLVEVLSGQTLGEYLHQHILAPLGMVDTGFSVPPAQQHRVAEPFTHDPVGGAPALLIDVCQLAALESGGGGLVSTAMDYARFLQFMLNRGELHGVRLLSAHTVDFMTADHLGNIPIHPEGTSTTVLPAGHGFGLGFAVRTATGLAAVPGSKGLYYWGGIAGTTFFVDPAQDLFAVMMIQAPHQREYYRPLFRSLVYAALVD